jgi:predicted metal-dependent peptidase
MSNDFQYVNKPDEKRAEEIFKKWDCDPKNPNDEKRMKERFEAAKTALRRAREMVMTANPFFGSLLYQMPYELWDRSEWHHGVCCTAFTTGRMMVWNPIFVLMLDEFELPCVMVHEILHPALQHIGRICGRDPQLWNQACDFAINLLIHDFIESQVRNGDVAMKWRIPGGLLIDNKYRGMSAEQIYGELLKHKNENDKNNKQGNKKIVFSGGSGSSGNGDQDNNGDPQNNGQKPPQMPDKGVSKSEQLRDLKRGLTEMMRGQDMTPEEEEELMNKWRDALIHAAACARAIGNLPAGIEQLINEVYKPVVDWRTVVRQFISVIAKDDYSWNRPSYRMIGQGTYTPSLYSRRMGEVVVILDDSGSMYHAIPKCVSEIIGLFYACKSTCLHFITCDTEPTHVCDWRPGESEPIINGTNQVKVIGGGGTSFVKPFHMIREQHWTPSMVLYFTDLDGELPTKSLDPHCPVLWICINDYHKQSELPFGKHVEMVEIVTKAREKVA